MSQNYNVEDWQRRFGDNWERPYGIGLISALDQKIAEDEAYVNSVARGIAELRRLRELVERRVAGEA